MAYFIVSYDLRDPHRDYDSLYTRLGQWNALRILESIWVIEWETESIKIRDDLAKHMDTDDGIIVAKLTGQAAWRKLDCSDQSLKTKLGGT